MLKYSSFVYLQNHKTGCSFVETYLRRFCAEPLLGYRKHAALDDDPRIFSFANVREPLALYRSLYAYGLDGKGQVYQRLKAAGKQGLYAAGDQGFADWLSFVLKPKNSLLLDDAYSPQVASLMGLVTWRFLRLACPGFEGMASSLQDLSDLESRVSPLYILDAVVKQEQLREGLGALTRTRLAHCIPDQEGALAWLAQADRINASVASIEEVAIPQSVLMEVLRQDWLIYQNFYPDMAAGYKNRIAGA